MKTLRAIKKFILDTLQLAYTWEDVAIPLAFFLILVLWATGVL